MKELGDILRLWERAQECGEEAVLATVVKTRGSSYRTPGARFLITESGSRAGAISGGCLEDDLAKKALWLTESGRTVRIYDTTPDGEISTSGYGLGCNGTIYVLLERLTHRSSPILDVIGNVLKERRCAAIVHPIEAQRAVEYLTIDASGVSIATLSDVSARAWLEAQAREALGLLSSRSVLLQSGEEFFIEVVTPAPHLLIFGAGSDAVPLTRLAKLLGWQVSVFDSRAHYVRRDKFPDADDLSLHPAGESLANLPIDPWTVAVLMSHSYAQDLANLRELANHPIRYLGILGPRKRTIQLLSDAGLNEDAMDALHGPMGLDVGADGAEQVALAVTAEIQAVLNERQGGLLRQRSGAIHSGRDDPAGQESFSVESIAGA